VCSHCSVSAGLAFFATALSMFFYPISREMNSQIADELSARRSEASGS
jgi:Na+/melibiose symporter-like transporter